MYNFAIQHAPTTIHGLWVCLNGKFSKFDTNCMQSIRYRDRLKTTENISFPVNLFKDIRDDISIRINSFYIKFNEHLRTEIYENKFILIKGKLLIIRRDDTFFETFNLFFLF